MRLFSRERDRARTGGSGDGSVSDVLGVASDRIRGIVDAAERAAAEISAKVRSSPGMQGDETSRISRERLVAELAESLVARAEELSREAESLADVLERASARLDVTVPEAAAVEAEPEEESAEPEEAAEPTEVVHAEAADPTEAAVIPSSVTRAIKPPEVSPSPSSGANLSERVSERFQDSSSVTAGEAASRFKRRPSSTKLSRPAPARSTDGLRLLATQMAVAGSSHEEIASRLRDEFGVEDATELLGEAPIARTVKESDSSG